MSDAPFRVEPTMHGNFGVADPKGRYFYTRSNKADADAMCSDLNTAWTAAGGPTLTRQRDEAWELLAELDAWIVSAASAWKMSGSTQTESQMNIDELQRMHERIAAALRERGE